MLQLTSKKLFVILAASNLLGCNFAGLPTIAKPNDASTTGSQIHVFQGTVPINSKPAADTQPSAATQQPDSTAASATPPQQPEEQASAPVAGADESNPSASSSTAASWDADARTDEEKDSRSQVQAAQHYALAAHYFSKWDLDLSEVELDETVSIYPAFKVAHRDLCLISLFKLNLPRCLAEFMMVTGLAEPTAYSEKDKSDLDARATRAHYRKALAWGKIYNFTESITELLWAQMYSPGSPAIHHSLAFAYASSGDFQRAEQEYKQTFASAPDDSSAHADFADLLMDNGRIATAEDEMRKAVQLSPNAAALHVDLGWIAESRNDLSTAEAEFKNAVKLSPMHAGLWAHLGRLMEHQGETADAQKAYSEALKLDSHCAEAKESLDRLKQTRPLATSSG